MLRIRCLILMLPLSIAVHSLALGQVDDLPIAEEAGNPPVVVSDELATATPDRKLRPLTVSIGLTDDEKLTGTLIESTEISIKTAFGEAAIPLSEVAGVRFPSADDTSTTVVMLNGDSITGATDLKFIGIETAWGSAKVNGQSITNLLFVPGLTWQATNSIGGKRWSLVESTAVSLPPLGLPQPAATNANQPRAQALGNPSFPQPQGQSQGQQAPRVIFGP